ncbi:MAG TPA: NapC/NirT family cytochrome c [Candidatus Acidoferrales bacterium]|nr:NapC/NirT family cytochrome c [Candidatus Acidoferrales bacterium]
MGLAGLIVALVVLTIVLAAVFFLRPSITAGATGKALAFVSLCVLPALCIAGGLSTHMQRGEETKFCISCHSMANYGKSLYIDDPNYVPAQHFQNHRVPADTACFSCHADYTIYGPLKDKLRGVTRIYVQYLSTPPEKIQIPGGYQNRQCLRCHLGARDFEANPVHASIMDSLTSNQLSCLSCHSMIHDASEVDHLKMWSPGK